MPVTQSDDLSLTTRRARRVRFWARAVGVALIASIFLLLGLVLTELALRTSAAEEIYRSVHRHAPHPFLQVTPDMAVDHVNNEGFRGDDVAPDKPPNALRIFTVGGSTTLGVTNSYPDSYPFLLQTELRRRHPGVDIQVLNAGAPWYTTAHDLTAYEIEVRRFNPDVVIFFEAINDLMRSFSPPWLAQGGFKSDYSHFLGPYASFMGPEARLMTHPTPWLSVNELVNRIRGAGDPLDVRHPENVAKVAARLTPVDAPPFRSLPSFRYYYAALIHAIQSDGHAVIAASQPYLYDARLSADERQLLYFAPMMCADNGTYPSLTAMINGMRAYNAAARDVAAAHGVPFVDFESQVPKTAEYFNDDVHMRRAGNAILAGMAADAVDRLGVVPAAPAGASATGATSAGRR